MTFDPITAQNGFKTVQDRSDKVYTFKGLPTKNDTETPVRRRSARPVGFSADEIEVSPGN
jgi:hypothetical protein